MNSQKPGKKKQKTNELKPKSKQILNPDTESNHLLSLSDQIEAFAEILSSHVLKSLYETDTD